MGNGRLWIVVDFSNGLPTNRGEIISYLVSQSVWGSGGRSEGVKLSRLPVSLMCTIVVMLVALFGVIRTFVRRNEL